MKTRPARRPGPRKETTPRRTDASATIAGYIRPSFVLVWSGVLELCALQNRQVHKLTFFSRAAGSTTPIKLGNDDIRIRDQYEYTIPTWICFLRAEASLFDRHVRPARGNARDRIRPKSLSILPSFILVLPLAGLVSVENNASPHNKQIHIGSVAISIIDP